MRFTPTSRLTRTYTSTERAAVPSGGRQVVGDAPGTALRERGPRDGADASILQHKT